MPNQKINDAVAQEMEALARMQREERLGSAVLGGLFVLFLVGMWVFFIQPYNENLHQEVEDQIEQQCGEQEKNPHTPPSSSCMLPPSQNSGS